MTNDRAITALSGDPRSKTLAATDSIGNIVIFACDNQTEWKALHTITSPQEVPATSLGTLFRGENFYIAGFANGLVSIITSSGELVCELSAHSRSINALACHPSKSVFATCSDDTFMHVYEVSGDRIDKLEVNLLVGSRVNDYQLVGVTFGGEGNNTVLAVPYDFKNIVVWNNIV